MNFADDRDREFIRSKIDIVELIESYIPLKKAGANYKAVCPFHKEKTPSFIVTPSKQIFHCFGCHRGGDIFSFVMEWEQISFPEALKRLADRCGYTLTARNAPGETVKRSQKERQYECLSAAASLFQHVLCNDPRAQQARDYFIRRGFSRKTIDLWRLGYIPSGAGFLRQQMQKKGFSIEQLITCGLVKKDERTGRLTDRFFNRIMFPICDEQGRIVAFGGRVLDSSEPKYINSPETRLYQKSKVLYGFSHAKQHIRELKSVLIVEGYFDVIQLHQAGVRTAVAPCGTSLTEEQITMLKRYIEQMYLAFDADQAGINAVVRKLDTILAQSINAKVVVLPHGEDPDSYVKKYGAENFEKSLEQGEPLLDFRLKLLVDQYGLDDEFARTKIAQTMMGLIARVSNKLIAESWLKRIEQTLGFSQDVLRGEMGKTLRTIERRANNEERRASSGRREAKQKKEEIPPWEKECIRLVLKNDEKIIEKAKKVLKKKYFFSTIIARIWENIFSGDSILPNNLVEKVLSDFREDSGVVSLVTELVTREMGNENPEIVFDDAVNRIRKEYIERKINSCMASLREARGGDVSFLLQQLQELKQEKIKLGVF